MPRTDKGKSARLEWLRSNSGWRGDDCLFWPFSRARGYGNLGWNGKIYYAHRVMCELAHGAAPSPAHQAAHSCGRGDCGCVNPNHLSWKTPSDNELDKRDHGTSRTHTNDGRRYKLSEAQVTEIRAMGGTKTHDEIAKVYGVSRRTIGMLLTGRSWKTGKMVNGTSASTLYRRRRVAKASA